MKTVSKKDLLELLHDFNIEVMFKDIDGDERLIKLSKGSLIPETPQFLNNILYVKTTH
jgi:hypothetical protein